MVNRGEGQENKKKIKRNDWVLLELIKYCHDFKMFLASFN